MNGMNFFTWIRDGVRQSVLLGVSDAVEQLGTPPNSEELHPTVAGFLGPQSALRSVESNPATKSRTDNGRKRLGRSLKEMNSLPPSP